MSVHWSCNGVQILKFTIRACRHVVLAYSGHVYALARDRAAIYGAPLIYICALRKHLVRAIVYKIALFQCNMIRTRN